jgi:hypothetical protein
LQLLGDMKSDAASLCEWLLFQKIEKSNGNSCRLQGV